jgi:hypothetical protein
MDAHRSRLLRQGSTKEHGQTLEAETDRWCPMPKHIYICGCSVVIMPSRHHCFQSVVQLRRRQPVKRYGA